MAGVHEDNFDRPLPTSSSSPTRMQPVPFVLLVLGGIFFLYQIVGGGITFLIFGPSLAGQNVFWLRFSTMAGQILFLLAPTLLMMKLQHGSFSAVLPRRVPGVSETILAVISVLSLQQFLEGYVFFQDKIPLPEFVRPIVEMLRRMYEETYRLLVHTDSVPEALYVMLVVAITPAICEEILFRGLIQKNLSAASTPGKGVLITGCIFGVYHLNPFLVVPLIVLGIYFSFLRFRSESILLPMIAHLANNCLAVIGSYAQPPNVSEPTVGGLLYEPSGVSLSVMLGEMAVFGGVFLVAFFFYMNTSSMRKTEGDGR